MKNFRELRVWQAAMIVVERIYMLTHDFPKQETYGLTSQIRRAAVSIPSNIAEGHTREHLKEYLTCQWHKRHWGSWKHNWRLLSVFGICYRERLKKVQSDINSLGKQLYALRNALMRQR